MSGSGNATGFSPETLAFLANLGANNSKEWFEANKADYERFVRKPAESFRTGLEDALTSLAGRPLSSKQFRINRDLRFSRDRTPYNTHIRMAFWPRSDAFGGRDGQPPSFFVSLEADHVRFGAGCMAFAKPVLARYLDELATGLGEELEALLSALQRQGFERSAPDLARVPKSVPATAAHAMLARHKGLAVWKTLPEPEIVCHDTAASELAALWSPTLPFWKRLAGLYEIS